MVWRRGWSRHQPAAPPPGPPLDCVKAIKRLRYTRERAAVQREIDRLQEAGAATHETDRGLVGQEENVATVDCGIISGISCYALNELRRDTPLSIEEKYDEVRQLIAIGKEKGYLLCDESMSFCPPTSRRRTSLTICSARSAAPASKSSIPNRNTARTSCSTAPAKGPRSSGSI